ncbi:MAG TPA: hypothetical protein VFM05_09970 [Candidatus Saccharimonadales bacterium]|nr:hypothetical protein [Candidatus Saccharimonadales bacterium]
MFRRIARQELIHAQVALFVAIGLQLLVWKINHELLVGPQYIIIPGEFFLVILLGFLVNMSTARRMGIHHGLALILLAMLSMANVSSLVLVLQSLIVTHTPVSGTELLASAIAIFITNIIVFALWYWEIDSPGLTRKRWSKNEQDFQFAQQDLKQEYPSWQPAFLDYLYLSLTNALNFAPADSRPLTHSAKLLMGAQALISIFTLALVIARSVSILG